MLRKNDLASGAAQPNIYVYVLISHVFLRNFRVLLLSVPRYIMWTKNTHAHDMFSYLCHAIFHRIFFLKVGVGASSGASGAGGVSENVRFVNRTVPCIINIR